MTTKPLTSLEKAAVKLLDELETGTRVTLEVSMADAAARALHPLLAAVHEEARHRNVGIVVSPSEGSALCLSLRRL